MSPSLQSNHTLIVKCPPNLKWTLKSHQEDGADHTLTVERILPELHASLLEIVSAMNGPERDTRLLALAGLTLEQALFPLLVLVGRFGPIGVVDLAGRVGRDYTTVSRQTTRLEELGLAQRGVDMQDRRTRLMTLTAKGREAAEAVDVARLQLFCRMFQDWKLGDLCEVTRLVGMLARGF